MKNKLQNILLSFKLFTNFKYNFLIIVSLTIIQIFFDILGIFLLGYLVSIVLGFDITNSFLNNLNLIFGNLTNIEIITLILSVFIIKFFLNILIYKKIFSYIKSEQKNLANIFAEKILYLTSEKKENIQVFNYFSELLRLSTEYYLVYFLKFISEVIILISILLLLSYLNFKLWLVLVLSICFFIIFFVNFNKKKKLLLMAKKYQ